jgi:hypothetical protein
MNELWSQVGSENRARAHEHQAVCFTSARNRSPTETSARDRLPTGEEEEDEGQGERQRGRGCRRSRSLEGGGGVVPLPSSGRSRRCGRRDCEPVPLPGVVEGSGA